MNAETYNRPRGQRATNPTDFGPVVLRNPTNQASRNGGTPNGQPAARAHVNSIPVIAAARAPANAPVSQAPSTANNNPPLAVAETFLSVRAAHALNRALGPDGPTAGLHPNVVSRREERKIDRATMRRLAKDTQILNFHSTEIDNSREDESSFVAPKRYSKAQTRRFEAERVGKDEESKIWHQDGQLLIMSPRDQKWVARLGWKKREKKRQVGRAWDRG